MTNTRSCTLAHFVDMLSDPRLTAVSLQKGGAEKELERYPHIQNLAGQINDFYDTAVLLQDIDLVISVDTSVVHLAAGLGRPVWVLVPFAPDWRWGLSAPYSPWYPDVRIFRQLAPNDWASVAINVKRALRVWIDGDDIRES
jgi:ADP-heptose:LPS heptosyltransferase